jgi:hypothetical protein
LQLQLVKPSVTKTQGLGTFVQITVVISFMHCPRIDKLKYYNLYLLCLFNITWPMFINDLAYK